MEARRISCRKMRDEILQLEEEKRKTKNLGWPYLPAIYEIPPKKKKRK
jgi:hypothetical protein